MGLSGQVSDSVVSPWHWWGPGQVLDLDLVPVPQVTEQEDQVPHSLKVPRKKCKIAMHQKEISRNLVLKNSNVGQKVQNFIFQLFYLCTFSDFYPFLDSEFLLFKSI